MSLVPIARAREHLKADDNESDALLQIYIDAAEKACSLRANRYFYADQSALDTAKAGVSDMMDAAFTAYDTAMTNAATQIDSKRRQNAEQVARAALDAALVEQSRILGGLVASNLIIEGFLLTIGHYYRNRESVVAGQGAAAVELPSTAEAIFGHLCYGIPML